MNDIAHHAPDLPAIAATADWPAAREAPPFWTTGAVAATVWLAGSAINYHWPDLSPWARTPLLAMAQGALGVLLLGAAIFGGRTRQVRYFHPAGRWLVALGALLTVWVVLTAKTALLPLPFFPPPQSILEVYTDDYARLLESLWYSAWLLVPGFVAGALAGFGAGVAIGWSRTVHYWGHPILRIVGPLPATAWLPVAFFFFPSANSASIFLIALSTGFPVAVLTASGISGVNSAYYDIARTLGANERFLIARIAIPAALPSVFVGLFMGLGASFAVLIVAEMMGVKAGLGFYLQWAQGWAAYANLYGVLILMALLFSGLISLLFLVRDRVLAWQKELVRW
ncbi:ABC transporter permease [Sphingobium jiangsuense]|uniref:NitT/TauT family transport system permease protein n=1 Tax=Sphingobium jiangsuense TaxID=870476 RepID=A0A7W6FNC3_9SPHN|nr:ABC transporter permease subunit [Sphingobium jiangsuense]MBB3924585.1 NitT/TauT family transport system permease protein [Sphingobium jiangsuense]GLT01703.1 ABC transporter permease [Sphingobium jiangsuense]